MTDEKKEMQEVRADFSEEKKRPINCDTVSWIMASMERYGDVRAKQKPSVSRANDAALFAALLEIMEHLGLRFEDKSARHNALYRFTELYENSPIDI